jgi:hypothetical protein
MNLSLIHPLLKKNDLDPEDLSNFFTCIKPLISFQTLKLAVKQLFSYLNLRSLFVPVQSAFRAANSTETALFQVLNDTILAVDKGDAVILALLDQSAAFDTIDRMKFFLIVFQLDVLSLEPLCPGSHPSFL